MEEEIEIARTIDSNFVEDHLDAELQKYVDIVTSDNVEKELRNIVDMVTSDNMEEELQFTHSPSTIEDLTVVGMSVFMMAYIPPHKRKSNEAERSLPTPDKLAPLFKNNVHVGSSLNARKISNSIYADYAISKWWTVGLKDDTQFPSSVNLEPISLETIEHRIGEKPLALINSGLDNGSNEVKWDMPKSPWVYMAKKVLEDIIACFGKCEEGTGVP